MAAYPLQRPGSPRCGVDARGMSLASERFPALRWGGVGA